MLAALSGLLWLFAAIVSLLFIAQPVSVETQLGIAVISIGIVGVISLLRLGGVFRHILLAISTALILRYVFWRATSTLPTADDLVSFVPAVLLFVAEMYCILMLAMSLFVVSDPLRRTPVPLPPDEALPTVDVFVPSYNEKADILALTLSAAKALDYPAGKLQVFLLDDGGTDQKRNSPDPRIAAAAQQRHAELRELCRSLGVNYLTRAANVHAKAGNLNNGLAHSAGSLVLVLDADHAPSREFLRETVGPFTRDPKLFLVQTPHFFSNPDPLERNLSTFERMPSENEMFYGLIQKGLDKWNAAFFCGSAALLRREALEQVGGFAGSSITEDAETALELHSRGWNSAYVDKPMITGLQPETLAAFIGQRSRWCQGMIQILLMKNPLFKSGLSFAQRICYLSSSMFWFFPAMRMAFILSPLLFIFFNLKIYVASVDEFVAYTVSYLIVGEIMRNYLYGRLRWPWVSELYEYVQSVYLLRAIGQVLINPRRPTFKVTAKGDTLQEEKLSGLAWPYFAIFAVLLAGLVVTVYRYQNEPEIGGLLLVVGAWNLLNLVIAGAALGVVVERRERRTSPRLPSQRHGTLVVGDAQVPVTVEDVSLGGARVHALAGIGPLDSAKTGELVLARKSGDDEPRRIPVGVRALTTDDGGVAFGLQFRLRPAEMDAVAELMLSDLEPVRVRRQARQQRRSTLAGSLNFVGWALKHPFRGFGHALFGRRAAEQRPADAARPGFAPAVAPAASQS